MSEERFRIVFTGSLRPGTDVEQCAADLARRFHIPVDKARKLVQRSQRAVLKNNLDAATLASYCAALDKIGMLYAVEPMPTPRAPVAEPENPYAAPSAELFKATEDGVFSGPHSRPISHGWQWLKRGFEMFRQNPGPWVVAIILWLVLSTVLSLIPVLGSLVTNLLSPVIAAGLMLGCREQHRGGNFRVAHLFAGFSKNTGQLVLLGVLLMVVALVIMIVMVLLFGSAAVVTGNLHDLQTAGGEPSGPAAVSLLIGILVVLLLAVPVSMAFFFAPVLVALEDLSAWSAMQQSLKACGRNVLPFLWYGVLASLFLFLGALPLGLGLLVVMPMLTASLYAAYRDIFYE